MDPEHYDNIFKVLTSQPLLNLSQTQILQIQKKAKHYIVRNNFLYKVDKRKEREKGMLAINVPKSSIKEVLPGGSN
jgi:hypothetical protein